MLKIELLIFIVGAVLILISVGAYIEFVLPELNEQNDRLEILQEELIRCNCFALTPGFYRFNDSLGPK